MPTASNIYYFAHGADQFIRPPVILLHGAGGTHLNWPAQIRRLSGQRVFALDLPGHGKSEGVGCQTIDDYTRVVIQFMKAVRLPAAVLVGHSMGGAIALSLALKHPKQTLGLGLVGSGAKLRVVPELLDLSSNPASFPSAIKLVTHNSYSPSANQRLKELGAKRMAEVRSSVFFGDLLACDSFDVTEQLKKLKVPAMIICGVEDLMTPPNRSEYLHDQIAGSKLHFIKGAGHMVMLEEPDEVAGLLGEFFNRISY